MDSLLRNPRGNDGSLDGVGLGITDGTLLGSNKGVNEGNALGILPSIDDRSEDGTVTLTVLE